MKYLHHICFSIIFLASLNTFAQQKLTSPPYSECGTPEPTQAVMQQKPYYGNNAYLTNFVDSLTSTFNPKTYLTCLNHY